MVWADPRPIPFFVVRNRVFLSWINPSLFFKEQVCIFNLARYIFYSKYNEKPGQSDVASVLLSQISKLETVLA